NFVWPVHFARASTLRKGLPTTLRFPLLPFVVIVVGAGLVPARFQDFAGRHKAYPYNSFTSIQTLARQLHRLAAHSCRGQFNRFIDFDVASAAAKIPRQSFLYFITRRLWRFLK